MSLRKAMSKIMGRKKPRMAGGKGKGLARVAKAKAATRPRVAGGKGRGLAQQAAKAKIGGAVKRKGMGALKPKRSGFGGVKPGPTKGTATPRKRSRVSAAGRKSVMRAPAIRSSTRGIGRGRSRGLGRGR
jgi:hypothetical protein